MNSCSNFKGTFILSIKCDVIVSFICFFYFALNRVVAETTAFDKDLTSTYSGLELKKFRMRIFAVNLETLPAWLSL